MARYIAQRLLAMLPTLLLLLLAVVIFARIAPSDVIDVILADTVADDITREELEARLGLGVGTYESYNPAFSADSVWFA